MILVGWFRVAEHVPGIYAQGCGPGQLQDRRGRGVARFVCFVSPKLFLSLDVRFHLAEMPEEMEFVAMMELQTWRNFSHVPDLFLLVMANMHVH